MKKVITIIISTVLIMGIFTACKGKPDDVSQVMYEYGVSALDVVDSYLDGKISASSAEAQLKVIEQKADVIGEKIRNAGSEAYINSEYKGDMLVGSEITSLYMTLSVNNLIGPDDQKVKEKRDILAKQLNK